MELGCDRTNEGIEKGEAVEVLKNIFQQNARHNLSAQQSNFQDYEEKYRRMLSEVSYKKYKTIVADCIDASKNGKYEYNFIIKKDLLSLQALFQYNIQVFVLKFHNDLIDNLRRILKSEGFKTKIIMDDFLGKTIVRVSWKETFFEKIVRLLKGK